MTGGLVALSPVFWEGVGVTVASFVLFVGTVYILLGAVFGLRMAYLVLAVSLFGWMIILSTLWAFGAPGTPPNLGPRGYEPHWVVIAAGTSTPSTEYDEVTRQYPDGPWEEPNERTQSDVESVTAVVQEYMAHIAQRQLEEAGTPICEVTSGEAGQPEGGAEELTEAGPEATTECLDLPPTLFTVQDIRFAEASGTKLVGAHGFYLHGGPELTVFARFDRGNVEKYSWSFLGASIAGFLFHLPFLDRAERRRKEILTGGTAPPWFGPA